ncbi:cation channel sperm-associated auxiliary subunit TMEM249-like [Amia ocellicauda]|uniref:cation channel sperm-associated auxiliary subunit TMEM249-like n=1 Tax=Amia ocellicauda TaxID=2972642 RepID=UPI0034638806
MLIGFLRSWKNELFRPEHTLNEKLRESRFHPFILQEPNVFVLEYRQNIWKAVILLIASIIGNLLHVTGNYKDFQGLTALFVFTLCLALWFMPVATVKRRVVIDHNLGVYKFYVHKQLRHQCPLNDIWIQMVAKKSEDSCVFYKLTLRGIHIDCQQLSGISECYEVMEILGKRMASRLNINYFDYRDVSARHLINQWPRHQNVDEEVSPV